MKRYYLVEVFSPTGKNTYFQVYHISIKEGVLTLELDDINDGVRTTVVFAEGFWHGYTKREVI